MAPIEEMRDCWSEKRERTHSDDQYREERKCQANFPKRAMMARRDPEDVH
jgi:hypothetical protein